MYPHAGLCQIHLKIALICWNYCFLTGEWCNNFNI